MLKKDIKLFVRLWYQYLFRRGYKWFSEFEKVKKFIASGLYKQRGRFARPFVHTAMGALVAMGVTLAPVLANSLPVTDKNQVQAQLPEASIMQVADDSTATVVSDKVRDKVIDYTVQSGDTISGIAVKFGISIDTIRWENNLASLEAIRPGQDLKILPVTGVRVVVGRGETIYSIAKKYSADSQSIVDFPFNTFVDNESFSLAVGQDLIVPDGKNPSETPWSPTQYVAQRTPDAGAVSAIGQFVWPISGVITQRWSWFHRAVDIATSLGSPVLAADAGRVIVAGWPDNSGYGNRVMIDHGNGFITLYGHLSRIDVTVGQSVNRGAQIGLEGSTGRSTGPHLHFEIRKGSTYYNPLDFLK